MKYLIFELFSGVGLCNQLFSLEAGIYLSYILDRKLIIASFVTKKTPAIKSKIVALIILLFIKK